MPIDLTKKHFEIVLNNMTQGRGSTHISLNFTPLFTNKLIGLKRVDRNRTTDVQLYSFDY